jgi:ParB family chromosome partitioning protein
MSELVQTIPLEQLHPFKNHPFKVRDDEAMQETADSILAYGVLVPAIARPLESGGYELISGHRRKRACELAGITAMPVIVRAMDDDTAIIMMVDANLQREAILPSERAAAYKMKLDAIRRKAGRPSKENSAQVGHHSDGKKSVQLIAEQAGDSKSQVQRYIRLTELVPELQQMVDEKKLGMTPAVELSYLPKAEQTELLDAMEYSQNIPSLSQAQRLKKASRTGSLTTDQMRNVLSEEKKSEQGKVVFTEDALRKYFPKSYTPKKMEETILKLLEQWMRRRQREEER